MTKNVDYINNMERAEEFIKAARLCYDNGLENAAATRAYYGALHAAVAALECLTSDCSALALFKGNVHKRVPALFDQRFANNRKLFFKYKGILHRLRQLREYADYRANVKLNKSDLRKGVSDAESLVGAIKEAMNNGNKS